MTTIKSHTDLGQSQKLSKILPPESADMWWLYVSSQGKHIAMMYEEPDPHYLARMESYGIKDAAIRCWSLAALLSVVPEEVSLNSFKDGNWNAMVQQNGKLIYGDANNPVDACYEMILKLHEQNLI